MRETSGLPGVRRNRIGVMEQRSDLAQVTVLQHSNTPTLQFPYAFASCKKPVGVLGEVFSFYGVTLSLSKGLWTTLRPMTAFADYLGAIRKEVVICKPSNKKVGARLPAPIKNMFETPWDRHPACPVERASSPSATINQ